MNILGAIFGSPKNTDKLVDGAVSGIDKLFYTSEEKAENAAKVGEWFIRYLEASQPQNLARRFIAIVVTLLWAVLVIAGIAIRWISYEASDFIFSVLKEIVAVPFAGIMAFYFVTHLARAYTGKAD